MKSLLLIITLCFLMACNKKDDLGNIEQIPGLGGDTWVKGPLDKWLYDTLTVPFNIAVKYKWDQFEFELNKTLVPPKEEKIIPVMSAIKKVWMNTYVAEAGTLFFKKYCPKYFILSGSASWNENGTITLGTAEGGRKVVLYLLNDFLTKDMPGYKPSDSAIVKQMFHVIEHEFGHILHQTTLYPVEFKRICAGLYTGNWNNISDEDAHRDGFVTPYAMSAFDEDFVEMISTMLVEGRTGFDMIVNSIPEGISINGVSKAEAQARLRKKESIVVSYFQVVWHIDFYSLQSRTRKEIVQLLY
jgi:substrate import-associated zinc metallohydrolase lipoprotein